MQSQCGESVHQTFYTYCTNFTISYVSNVPVGNIKVCPFHNVYVTYIYMYTYHACISIKRSYIAGRDNNKATLPFALY